MASSLPPVSVCLLADVRMYLVTPLLLEILVIQQLHCAFKDVAAPGVLVPAAFFRLSSKLLAIPASSKSRGRIEVVTLCCLMNYLYRLGQMNIDVFV